jgi:hypothetical protein
MHDGPGGASRRKGDGSFVSLTILARAGTLELLVPLREDWGAPMIWYRR